MATKSSYQPPEDWLLIKSFMFNRNVRYNFGIIWFLFNLQQRYVTSGMVLRFDVFLQFNYSVCCFDSVDRHLPLQYYKYNEAHCFS